MLLITIIFMALPWLYVAQWCSR